MTKKDKKESSIKRTWRGLKIIYKKICDSNYVKGMQEEERNTNWQDAMPKSLSGNDKQEDVFSTDFSKLGKVNI
jgi:hypothetical protein